MTKFVDPIAQDRHKRNPGKPAQARARVVRAPGDDGYMRVQIIGWGRDQAYEIPPSNWSYRPNPNLDTAGGAGPPLSPQVGDLCLLLFDHLGDGWVGANWG